MKILVVGGGIAGLTIGWRLAQSGYHVGVIERGRAGRSATWAAAGMLGSAGEHVANPAMSALAAEARAMWPAFASDLAAASGHEFGFCRNGALRAAFDAGECAAFATRARELVAVGDAAEWVDAATARKIAPLIASDVLGALFFRDEAQVDNRRLSVALVAALTRAGGVLHEGVNVHSLSVVENRITGVVTTTGNLRADAVVIAAGAWSALLGANLPEIRPAKGQMLALAPDGNDHLPIPTLWGPGIYLVPRNGRLFVGATVEDVGFDTSVTRAAHDTLLARAHRLAPGLRSWQVIESWAGLRPRSPDDAPVFGPADVEGLFIAGGQFRNGILLAPLIADALNRFVSGKSVGYPASAFSARRFSVP